MSVSRSGFAGLAIGDGDAIDFESTPDSAPRNWPWLRRGFANARSFRALGVD